MRLYGWGATDVGRKRDHNEDSFLIDQKLGLFVVADGMGGHLGGDRASRMAVEILQQELKRLSDGGTGRLPVALMRTLHDRPGQPPEEELPEPARALREATRTASTAIYELAQSSPQLQGMGTTVTSLLYCHGRVHLGHVGDSRAYRFRDGKVEQLTEDHSWIHEQVKAGLLREADARDSKFKHIITRSVGFERDVLVDLAQYPVALGDCFILCSDGLSNCVGTDELVSVLTAHYYRRAPQVLCELANERGGEDNITVVVVYAANE
jgi:protein phosphatase